MMAKLSSKHQITIPSIIASVFHLKKGDILEIETEGNRIVMTPKEVIYEDKYSAADLQAAEQVLSKGLPKEEISLGQGEKMVGSFRKRMKK